MFAGFFANAQKFGIVNSQEIIQMLPEVKEASANIETFGTQLQKKYQGMITALQTKYQELERKQAQGEISPKQLEEEAKKHQYRVKDIVRAVALSDLLRKR